MKQVNKLQTVCGRIKLKANCLDKAREWAQEINDKRRMESLETLRDEEVYLEVVFLEKTNEGHFLIYFMKVKDMKQAGKTAKSSKHSIDAYHQQFKKTCWESNQQLELLVDLDRYSELYE